MSIIFWQTRQATIGTPSKQDFKVIKVNTIQKYHVWKSRSASKSKIRNCGSSKWSNRGPWTLTSETWRLYMKTWKVCRLTIVDSHHFDAFEDPDPDQHQSDK
jgi:hypothetical protein